MRKYWAIAVMICLSASLLMGCGGSGGGDKNVGAQSKAKEQAVVQQQSEAKAEKAQAKEQADQKVTEELPSQTDGYAIFVRDANSKEPLSGVKVQFCSDTMCMMGVTDNTGVAVFNMDPGNYEAHILKPPAGYQKSSETAALTADDKTAVFGLLKVGEELKAADAADGTDAAAEETGEKSTEKKSDHCSKTDAEWFCDMTGFTFKAVE